MLFFKKTVAMIESLKLINVEPISVVILIQVLCYFELGIGYEGKWSFRLMPFRLKSFRLTCLVTSPNFFRRNVFYFGHFA